ncbi:coiled-coil-helix-coiled-coil-helix domain-containing protein 5 isoform X2 [Pteropus alecto]|uniref:coiled-coil-helix-coiled-coil-helix domain-containing protein 5 isoform X2 n=1 Tax=Pteropus alecto TaxID=9402 RepID=UPI000D53C170|nr:coiled-coil-helix-coiled-coil-helix domain-containing protein 5 isoform X2 [Pteropus alecto]
MPSACRARLLSGDPDLGRDPGGGVASVLVDPHPRMSRPAPPWELKTLRQAALEVTARHCSRELDQYGQCVAAKPESWQRDCHHLKMSIARCTSSHPIIRRIRQACAEPFEAFEECLRQNEAATNNCVEQVRRFLQCAEQVPPPGPPTVQVLKCDEKTPGPGPT